MRKITTGGTAAGLLSALQAAASGYFDRIEIDSEDGDIVDCYVGGTCFLKIGIRGLLGLTITTSAGATTTISGVNYYIHEIYACGSGILLAYREPVNSYYYGFIAIGLDASGKACVASCNNYQSAIYYRSISRAIIAASVDDTEISDYYAQNNKRDELTGKTALSPVYTQISFMQGVWVPMLFQFSVDPPNPIPISGGGSAYLQSPCFLVGDGGSGSGSGSGTASTYAALPDKPQIGGVVLLGNKTPAALGLASADALGEEVQARAAADTAFAAQISDAAKAVTSNMVLYVASDGDDGNDGTSAATAFATIEKAITEGCKYRSCIINLAAGAYTMAAGSIEIRGAHSLSIRGAGAAETTINGRFSIDRGAYVNFTNMTINSTTDAASNGGIFGFEACQIYLTGVTISATTGACVNLSTGSCAYINSCTFGGTPIYTVRCASGARAVVRSCTGMPGKNARAEVSGELHIDNCTDMSYVNATQGIVYADGVQVLPAQ